MFTTLIEGHHISALYPRGERDTKEQDKTILSVTETRNL